MVRGNVGLRLTAYRLRPKPTYASLGQGGATTPQS